MTMTTKQWRRLKTPFGLGLIAAAMFGTAGIAVAQGTNAAAGASGKDQVTFTKDVAPILQRACQNCHRPDSMAPMSFLTYEDVRPWARAIKQKVSAREMPPWFIDRTVGISQFKDDPSLSSR